MSHIGASDIATNTGMDSLMADVKDRGYNLEVERLTANHRVYTDAADGKLSLIPIDWKKPGLRILDSATADGVWLHDLRKEAGDAIETQTYVGADLVEDFFPKPCPKGMEFYRQSITEPWPEEWKETFDVVHQRQVLGFCGTFPIKEAIANLCKLAKPGGWVELGEFDMHKELIEEDNAGGEIVRLLEQTWEIKGMGGNFAAHMKQWMEEAGLEDVQETRLICKVGAKARPEMKETSILGVFGAAPMIVALARDTPGLKGFTTEQLDTLVDRLHVDLREKGMEFHSKLVMGRVPAGGLKPKPAAN